MKIGILTFHHSLNCGAVLQAWALQTYLRQCGYDAEVVNYGRIGWPVRFPLACRGMRAFVSSVLRCLRSIGIEDYRRSLYRTFLRERMELGACVSKTELENPPYTHLIVGSDQVWHPVINEGDDTYFLAHAPDGVCRISYAPSFGVDRFSPELETRMAEWLADFDALSVREPQGGGIIKRLCGREATVVCDPTLLLDVTQYEQLECVPRFGLPKRYVAVYTICGHPWAEAKAIEIGRQMHLPVVHLPGGQFARWYLPGGVKHITALGPSEWLYFMHHADYVVTNSFHGTVFSLLYHRPFLVAANNKASDARMRTLLQTVGLEENHFKTSPECSFVSKIDWTNVDTRIRHLRETGVEFLSNSMTV